MRHDDDKILAALKAQGRTEFIKVTESLDWKGLKAEVNQTGEAIDGITWETVPEEFTVQINRKE